MSFARLVMRYRMQVIWLCLLEVGASSFVVAAPYFSKLFIDQAFLNRDFGRFLHISLWGAVLFAASLSISCVRSVIKHRLEIILPLEVRHMYLRHLFSMELSFFQSGSTGEQVYRLLDTDALSNFFIDEFPDLITDCVKLACVLVIAFAIDARMAFVAVMVSPLFIVRSVVVQRKLRQVYEDIWQHSCRLSAQVNEAVSKILLIKANAWEGVSRRMLMRSYLAVLRSKAGSFRWEMVSVVSSAFLSKFIYALVMLYGGWLIIKGRTTLGNYSAVMLYLTTVAVLVEGLAAKFEYAAQHYVSLRHFRELMDVPVSVHGGMAGYTPEALTGQIRFDGVSFAFVPQTPVFSQAKFVIPAASWVGICGASGAGKTTLANLMLRLYDAWSGRIEIDGQNIRRYDLGWLRRHICMVTQQPLLFNATVADNLSYGLKGISVEQLRVCARAAGIDEEIMRLPRAYDTLIGEDACILSQGQKQRLALARALARDPDILILDEATSSVDMLTEERIFRSIRQSRVHKATIVISHRLPLVRDADTVIFLKSPGVVLQGGHQQLWDHEESYRQFFAVAD